MGNLRLRGVCLLVVSAALVAIGPERSGADTSCDEGEVCLWEHADFQGCFADEEDTNFQWEKYSGWDNCPGGPDRKVSSYRNRSLYPITFYEDQRALGRTFCVAPNASGDVPRTFNDRWRGHSRWRKEPCIGEDND